MPIYHLKCKRCGFEMERWFSYDSFDDEVKDGIPCPTECGGLMFPAYRLHDFIVYSQRPNNPEWYDEEDAY